MQMNRVEVAGFLAARPQLRYLPSGTPVANARLGQSYRYQDSNQQVQEHTNWHNLSFYGELSAMAAGFDKGQNIFVEGTIERREFTPKDGVSRTIHEIVVRHCHVIASQRHNGSAAPANGKDVSVPSEPVPHTQGSSPNDQSWPVR